MQNKLKILASCLLLAAYAFVSPPSMAQTSTAATSTVDTSKYTGSGGGTSVNPACHGKVFNPFKDMDWNLLYPITIAGIPLGGGVNPPLMYEPPVCVCPGPFGIPSIGIGLTFWEPLYVSEIQRMPGCLSTIGGVQILSKYASLHGEHEGGSDDSNSGTTTRMQGHWYTYPVFGMLDIMKDMACKNSSGFALGYITEIDPTWQDDAWGAVFSPESSLFANLVAQAVCAVDSVSSQLGFAMDPLFWCAGATGSMYPLTGNSGPGNGPYLVNAQVQAKFLFRLHRLGLLWETIGPTATCFSHPNPIIVKSQYRINQIGPVPRRGSFPAPVIGSLGELLFPPAANAPGWESTDNMIWQGQQCCARLY